jgi:3-hydroxyacyl-CoA dehydrogenase
LLNSQSAKKKFDGNAAEMKKFVEDITKNISTSTAAVEAVKETGSIMIYTDLVIEAIVENLAVYDLITQQAKAVQVIG